MKEKIAEQRVCEQCKQEFQLFDLDLAYFQKFQVPTPRFCPSCRQQRRLLQVNEIHLFKRTCSFSGKSIVSNYPQDTPTPIYAQELWFSEEFDACEYGQEFDFSRTFTEQFYELSRKVPLPSLYTDYVNDENSAYTNFAARNKNCYLIFEAGDSEDCYYCYGMERSRNCSDCTDISDCELCYGLVDSFNCYNSHFLTNCQNCTDSLFLNNCIGCKSCILSNNLSRCEYHIRNKPVAPEEYDIFVQNIQCYSALSALVQEFLQLRNQFPQKAQRGFQNENCIGNYIRNCKNAFYCFDSSNIHDGRYLTKAFNRARDCVDGDNNGEAELIYDSISTGIEGYNCRFCVQCFDNITDLTYCWFCMHAKNLFGCISVRRQEHCILNKKYSRSEYQKLIPQIIDHMCQTGEWGDFFNPSTSLVPYNLSMAMEHYPLSESSAIEAGYLWKEETSKQEVLSSYELPDSIVDVGDDILRKTLYCASCSRPYRLIQQELSLLKQLRMPVPRDCFYCRLEQRSATKDSRHLWECKCNDCSVALYSTHPPESEIKVLCNTCYANCLD